MSQEVDKRVDPLKEPSPAEIAQGATGGPVPEPAANNTPLPEPAAETTADDAKIDSDPADQTSPSSPVPDEDS